ncbi:protein kinase [Desulfobulbus sp. AH-315-M07]|nr:protein kinase [Desulfobulbus sp. AH-315-M07]
MAEGLLDRFEVQREVGRGAAGIVFEAWDRQDGSSVALKVIARSDADEAERLRFLDEGALLSNIDHPGIIRIVDFGTVGSEPVDMAGQRFEAETPYIAMEWLSGEDLQQRHASQPLSLRESLEIGRQLAEALGAAHQAGIVHRDVKPSNIFVLAANDGEVRAKLLDFGIACSDQSLGGTMIGTPAYMAPEQARGDEQFDKSCDVYSLGATLFELIAGRPPHTGSTPIAMLAKVVSTPAPRLSELVVDVPLELDELVANMLELESSVRPHTSEVRTRLSALCNDPRLPQIASAIEKQHESVHSSVSRLVTALVALHVATGAEREAQLAIMREMGAEAVPLGKHSVVAYLGARRAHGKEATRAIELGKQLTDLGAQVGIATGRALVDLARPIGETVDQASTLAREAKSGQMLAEETTIELARTNYEFVPSSRGVWIVGAVVPERRETPEIAPFVGRGTELERCFTAYDRCLESAEPVLVSISGPPGIGKSRLGREFLKRVDEHGTTPPNTEPSAGSSGREEIAEIPVRVVQARSEAYGRQAALGLAADALNDLLRIPKGAGTRDVERALEPIDLVHDEHGLLASLLAGEAFPAEVDARRARDILYLAMTELMLKITHVDPCVIVLEDVQWADFESVAWFDHLLSRATGRSLFLLIMARPSFWRDYPHRFTGRDHERIELRPVARRATMEIARAVIGCDLDDPQLVQVAKQAAGSPLFAEELARVIATGKPAAMVPTIEAAIQVSLDVLEPSARDALVHMSVFGLTGWDDGLKALGVDDCEEVLKALSQADLLVALPDSRFALGSLSSPCREYRFKHALVRDVTYASASDVMRKGLHASAAAWFVKVGEDAATIAEHYDLGDQQERAADFWEIAARRALAATALRDAVKMADRALMFAKDPQTRFKRATLLDEAYSRLDERSADRVEAIEAMADSAHDDRSEVRTEGARARYDHARSAGTDIEERLLEVVRRSAELGMLDEQARCSATLASRYAFAGELSMAEAEAAQLLKLAEDRGVQSAAVDAWQTLAIVHQTRGELAAALEARRNAAHAARAAGLKQREATLTINVGFALTTIGARDEALNEIEAGILMAEEIGSSGTVRLGRMILLCWVAQFGADPSLDAALAEPRGSADEAATGGWIVKDRVTLGVLFYRGCELLFADSANLGRARSLLKISAEAYRATGNNDVLPVALGYWAEAERRLGELEVAEKIAREAADLVEAGAPSLLGEAVIYLALHGARVDLGNLTGARQAVERAMPALVRRVRGLRGTAYERTFLTGIVANARLLEAADTHGCVPKELERVLSDSGPPTVD